MSRFASARDRGLFDFSLQRPATLSMYIRCAISTDFQPLSLTLAAVVEFIRLVSVLIADGSNVCSSNGRKSHQRVRAAGPSGFGTTEIQILRDSLRDKICEN